MAATAGETRGATLPEALGRALDSLAAGEPASTWSLSDAGVADGLGMVGEIRHLLEVAEVALTREGVSRGLPQAAGWGAHDWVARTEGQRAPAPPPRHVAQVLRVAQAGSRTAALVTESGAGSEVAEVVEAFVVGDLPLGKADQLARFHTQVAQVADPEMLAHDMGVLLEGARDEAEGPRGGRVQGLTEKELAVAITKTGRLLKPVADLDREHRRSRAARMFQRSAGPAGTTSYRVTLDPEGAAILDAAIDALSRPVPAEDGTLDERSATQRRADALVEIVRRGVSSPGEAPKTEKAQVLVTIPYAALADAIPGVGSSLTAGRGAQHLAGVTATGDVLPPDVVRRMACDAAVIPVVLGSDGEILDLGTAVRLYTPALRRAIWHRDGGCTYPGCTMPPQWCDAHHVVWWSRGGPTSLDNAALLCQRHHTLVHDRDLTATVTATGVTWHL